MKKSESSNIRKNSDWQDIDYKVYRLSKKEWFLYSGQGIFYLAVFSFVFYRSVAVFLCGLPLGICYPLVLREDLRKKRQESLQTQFKDMILSLASCLNAGYSVENGFAETLRETDRVYGKESMISSEIQLLLYKLRLNQTIGEALKDFAERSGLDDVKSFANVFLTARESGGELVKIISGTVDIIGEKIRIQEDILTATASRRLEQKIMSMIPVFIVLYMELTSPGFFQILYTTVLGRMIMTACFGVYLLSCFAAKKILEIEI